MNPETVTLLNQLNTEFYQTVASSFDATRATPWSGWFELLPHLEGLGGNLRVLDLGCGNGRFGVFLADHLDIHYTGLDSSAFLLERAAEDLTAKGIPHTLQAVDLLNFEIEDSYDLVGLFGVLHHIPGFENRRALIDKAVNALKPRGLLVLTFWAFYEQERLRKRIIAWENAPTKYQTLDLEPGDYLLDWQRETPALRYCHYVDAVEGEKLLAGYKVIAQFEADQANHYVLIRR
jgi:tRNA (uracil-5-)-methyltransferase TRM9